MSRLIEGLLMARTSKLWNLLLFMLFLPDLLKDSDGYFVPIKNS